MTDAESTAFIDKEGWRRASLDAPDMATYGRLARALMPVSRYFRTTIDGADRIPQGAALLVGNHATWGIDTAAMLPPLVETLGRPIRGLAERMLFASAPTRALCRTIGVVPGTRENAHELLTRGELCLCYPGGDKDSFKRWWQRHTLKWEGRTGYVRTALAANVPIISVLGVGIDDAFPVVGQDRLIARRIFGSRRYDLPVFLGASGLGGPTGPFALPLPVQFHFEVGEPISLDATDAEREAVLRGEPEVESLVERHHQEVWSRVQGRLDALATRHDSPTRARWAARLKRFAGG
jgi:1-acyl-sn-glycerol-3-phosphate acyltransferase